MFFCQGYCTLFVVVGFFYVVVEPFLRQGNVSGAAIILAIVGLITSTADAWAGLSRGWPPRVYPRGDRLVVDYSGDDGSGHYLGGKNVEVAVVGEAG